MKIICESCETVFKSETVKGMTNCPVCGAAFDSQMEEVEEGTIFTVRLPKFQGQGLDREES